MQKRPALVVGGVVGLLVLVALSRSGGATDTAGAFLESQRIASDTNIALAGIQGDVMQANLSAGVARNEIARDIIIGREQIAADVTTANINAQVSAFTAMLNSTDTRAAIRANQDIVNNQTAGSVAVALAGYDTQYKMLDRTLSHEQALSTDLLNRYDANLPTLLNHEMAMKNLDIAGQAHLISTDYSGQIHLARVTGEPARINAETNRSAQRNSVIGDVVNAVAKLFG